MYGITCAEDSDEATFLAQAERALAQGLRLLQVRDKTWPLTRRLALARRLVAMAHPVGARVLWNGTAEEARDAGCDGVHWPAALLAQATERPRDLLMGASCHTREEIAHAGTIDLDFAVLGPVAATPTHPDAVPLGWERFAETLAATRVPVFALGGLVLDDLSRAVAAGAHGIALRRAGWRLT